MPSDFNFLLCAYLQYPNFPKDTSTASVIKGVGNELRLCKEETSGSQGEFGSQVR